MRQNREMKTIGPNGLGVMMSDTAAVKLWGRTIGAVSWEEDKKLGFFEYTPEFIRSDIQVAPFMMPLSETIYSFPALSRTTFNGLPGMLADCLPDKFGNLLIDAYLQKEGRSKASFNPVQRLCYVGTRGMGALEFEPAEYKNRKSKSIKVEALVDLANQILKERTEFKVSLLSPDQKETMEDILRVGTSAGGARAKAVVAWNPKTNEIRSGQVTNEPDYSYWILKFDGIEGNKDKELTDPKGFGLIEYAYYKMAKDAGIHMMESRLLKENGRSHFMTKRFDRTDQGGKIHLQSLGALSHYDYNMHNVYSYEQAILTMRKLKLSMDEIEQQYRRTAFNIIARNQDDHVKNISFLMDKQGRWSLSPAYDMVYSFNPTGDWTGQHQMSMNGKWDDFVKKDFEAFSKAAGMRRGRYEEILHDVRQAVSRWQGFAEDAGVAAKDIRRIAKTHRLDIP